MKRLLLFFLFSILGSSFHAQTYAYSFEGNLTQEKQIELTEKISHLVAVTGVKLKIKAEQNSGEFIIIVDPLPNRGENDHPFSPISVKELFIQNGLQPLQFRKLQ